MKIYIERNERVEVVEHPEYLKITSSLGHTEYVHINSEMHRVIRVSGWSVRSECMNATLSGISVTPCDRKTFEHHFNVAMAEILPLTKEIKDYDGDVCSTPSV